MGRGEPQTQATGHAHQEVATERGQTGGGEQVHYLARLLHLSEDHVLDGRQPPLAHCKAQASVGAHHLHTAAAHPHYAAAAAVHASNTLRPLLGQPPPQHPRPHSGKRNLRESRATQSGMQRAVGR